MYWRQELNKPSTDLRSAVQYGYSSKAIAEMTNSIRSVRCPVLLTWCAPGQEKSHDEQSDAFIDCSLDIGAWRRVVATGQAGSRSDEENRSGGDLSHTDRS
jgi:hypothetical protein